MVNISSSNGMQPVRRQAITQTDVEYLPMSSVYNTGDSGNTFLTTKTGYKHCSIQREIS